MEQEIIDIFSQSLERVFQIKADIELSIPDENFGDFSTNVALRLAKQLSKAPIAIAEALVTDLNDHLTDSFSSFSVAGAGFINLTLSTRALVGLMQQKPSKLLASQVVVAEYSDPNPFKMLHAGHLYTSIVGDAIANLLAQAGAEVHRVNFGGDVGLHVAKNLWAMLKFFDGKPTQDKLDATDPKIRAQWLSDRYVEGNNAYEYDETSKKEIQELNKAIYQLMIADDHDSELAVLYWTTRKWSYDAFDDFYKRLDISFEKYYPESSVMDLGLKTVKANIPKVYQESDGAIIFDGEKYGLYTNVFINSAGLPTYAAKDVGLIMQKWQDYKFDKSLIITSNEILDYMRVVQKSVEQFRPDLEAASIHLSHGVVKLASGVKMSSRLGNILKADDILEAASSANTKRGGKNDDQVTIGAVKYAFLKQRIGGDILYDPDESVSLEGNSGPYLQYAQARARNILAKVSNYDGSQKFEKVSDLTSEERLLVRKLGQFSQVVDQATIEFKPHYICGYLYELAQIFNRFYENSRVINDPRQELRLKLVGVYADVLTHGLSLMGIAAPDKM